SMAFAGSDLALCLSKTAYGLLPLGIFTVAARKGNGRLKLFAVAALGVGLLVSFLAASDIAVDLRGDGAAHPRAQMRYIFDNPDKFAASVFTDLLLNGPRYLREMIGVLGWLDIRLSLLVVIPYACTLLLVSLTEQSRPSLRERIVLVMLSLTTILGIVFSQVLLWTPVGAEVIEGPQGRYFIPVAPFLLAALAFAPIHGFLANRAARVLPLLVAVVTNGVAVFSVVQRFT
ncbi:MAG TPA: DUF2142 domain-containing protein, partial [Thermoanaerobaculia bacterium]|nr:DUF2142 domain-containing protein [Thermoanaerobaculia bacterium]